MKWCFAVFTLIFIAGGVTSSHNKQDSFSTASEEDKDGRGLFSPRMEYDEWTPLGRGDPLKNDPTYDYVPPVLDRVHYWVDPAARTPDPPLSTSSPPSSVVALGSSNVKKTTPKPDTRKTPHADSRRDYYDPLVHFIDGPKFGSGGGRIRPQYIPVQNNYYSFRPPQRPPYTMLVPPPPGKPESYPVGSTAPGEFVFHTESTTTPSWEAGKTQLATLAPASSQPAKKPSDVVITMETTTPLDANTLEYNREVSPMMEVIHAVPEESLPSSFLHLLLQNEVATTPTTQQATSVSTTPPTITFSSSAATTTTTVTTTTNTPHPSLTTDPLFSHYKQPVEPLRGPMYLIIQGHSKVKTYGASKLDKISGIPVQDNNDVGEGHRRRTRQVDITDFIPVEEAIEAVIRDYVDDQGPVGSGIGELLTSYS